VKFFRRGVVVALASALGVAAPSVAARADAPVAPAESGAQAALSRAASHYAGRRHANVAVARSSLGSMRASTTTKVIGDPAGDNSPDYDPRGDLLAVAVSRGATAIAVGVGTRTVENPNTSYNWQGYALGDPAFQYGTGIEWKLDVNRDGNGDYDVFFVGSGSGIYSVVTPASDVSHALCPATPTWDPQTGYFAAFAASCIGNPAQVRADAFMTYETPSTLSEDITAFTAAATRPRPPTALAKHVTFNCTIRAKANNKYVTTEVGDNGGNKGRLRARADTVGSSRKYQCVAVGKEQWAIKSRGNHKYVIAEGGSQKGRLRAWAPKIGPKGTFVFKSVAKCSCFAIKAANKRFVTAHVNFKAENYGLLRAGAAGVGTTEEFEIRGG
jgi:hypothetical protein